MNILARDPQTRGATRASPTTATAVLRVSVVVPTYRRPALLRRCLAALIEQDIDPATYEIIVADDAPDDATLELVRSFDAPRWMKNTPRPRVRYVAVHDTQGPAGARNAGWRSANAPIIAFTDDDTVPEPNWLSEGLAALTDDIVAASGAIAMDVPINPTDYERDAARLAEAEFATANCFVRRNALAAIDGFDERFTSAWREDTDLQFALMEIGRLGKAPMAVVRHPIRPAPWGVSLSQQRKIQFDALLYRKHPDLYRQRIRRAPRWDYYATVAALVMGVGAAIAGEAVLAAMAFGAWVVLTTWFCLRRLRGTSHEWSHVVEMIVTSISIPPLACFWRLVGALRWRTFLF